MNRFTCSKCGRENEVEQPDEPMTRAEILETLHCECEDEKSKSIVLNVHDSTIGSRSGF